MRKKISLGIALATIAAVSIAGAIANTYSNPNGSVSPGFVQEDGNGNTLGGYGYSNITTATTTTVKSGAGILHAVCMNTVNATSTLTIFDSLTGAGNKIGTVTQPTGVLPGCINYDVAFKTGLTIVTATGTPDYTISFR